MTSAPAANRQPHAQQQILAALASVRAALERHIARARGDTHDATIQASLEELVAVPPAKDAPAVAALCSAFGLSSFERDLLLLCAGVELDASFATLCAAAQGEPQRTFPTFSLALAALPGAHWSALTPEAPLRRWRLIAVERSGALTTSPLRIEERVLHFLAGVSHLDERLVGLVTPVAVPQELASSHRALAEQVTAAWTSRLERPPLPLVALCGDTPEGRRAIAARACAGVGLRVYVIQAGALPTGHGELAALARLWEREAALSQGALLVERDEQEVGDAPRAALTWLLDSLAGAVLVSSREAAPTTTRPTITIEVRPPSVDEQRALWRAALGGAAERLNGQLDQIVSQFSLAPGQIRTAAAESQRAHVEGDLASSLWQACRIQARPRLDSLAQRIDTAATWDDLVLPEAQRQTLRDMASHVRQRVRVYHTWGMGAMGGRGLGISALFAGASGTGKTLASEVVANALGLDLYRIDLSAVVSKYIGETEKNLRRIFDAAEVGGAVLLFDEADALFGKRSEVKDSHDRYANIEVSYLLQRVEAYRGLAILTTNLKQALDTAFLRRIRFVVQFPFPDTIQRAAIWRRAFPPTTPTEGLDVAKLARLNVAGGNIRNIALGAAFLAADADEPVQMRHLLRSARAEYTKLERPLTEGETAMWE